MSNFEPFLPDISGRTAVKSSSGACVQVARRDGVIIITHSKHPDGPAIAYTLQEFDAFLDGAKKGEFDDFLSSLYSLPLASGSSGHRQDTPGSRAPIFLAHPALTSC
jgi:hypothetical protein